MWIFTGMFLTFGALIVLGGILLIVNMFLGLVEGRRREIGILKSQGAGLPEVGAQLLSENAVYTLVIVIIGISGGLAVGWGIIHALNTVWAGSVESNSVPFHFGWDTLLISAAASILICLLSVAIPSLRIARMNVSEALTVHGGGSASTTGNTGKPWGLLPVVGLTILIVNGFMTLPSSAVLVMIAYFLMLTGSGIFLYRQHICDSF